MGLKMSNYDEWNRDQLLAFVKVQEEELLETDKRCLFRMLFFTLAGALASWILHTCMI
jgi:hypothetical protein